MVWVCPAVVRLHTVSQLKNKTKQHTVQFKWLYQKFFGWKRLLYRGKIHGLQLLPAIVDMTDCQTIHTDRYWQAYSTHQISLVCKMFLSWENEAENSAMMEEICHHDGGGATYSKFVMVLLLLQFVGSVMLKRRSRTCCLWGFVWMWQPMSSLYNVITPSEELLSSCIIMNNQISGFLFLMTNLNDSKRMDTNSKPSSTAPPEVCSSVLCPFFKTSLTSCSHLSIVSQEESSMVWNSAALKHMLKGQFTEEDAFLPAYSRKWFNF